MNKTIYFVRHGETTDNQGGLVGGAESDSALTNAGVQQAREAAQRLKDVKFDLVVSSPLTRARKTAEIILGELGQKAKVIPKQEFIEKYVGKEFARQPYTVYKAFKLNGGRSGESEEVMLDRVQSGLEWLQRQDFTNALVVSHSATIANVRTIVEDIPLEQLASVPRLGNGEIYKVSASDIPLK